MSNLFFDKFPIIQHNNYIAKNIVAKVSILPSVRQNTAVFFPYTVGEGERADTIASVYYDDPELYWLIYFANNIVDPYHEWPKDQTTLDDYIAEKYNSVANAQETILRYAVNWYGDDRELSPAGYEALSAALKKYWSPNITPQNKIISYRRKAVDWELATNSIVELTVASNANFSVGERVYISTNEGTVVNKHSTDKLVVQHITGTFPSSGTLASKTTSSTTTISAANVIYTGISTAEQAYWSPVYAYEYELQQNERRRNIQILDRGYVDQIIKEMTELLT